MSVSRSTRWVGTLWVGASMFVLWGWMLRPLLASAEVDEQVPGKDLYVSSCSRCHGVDASGSAEGPNLQDALAKSGAQAVADTILKGRPGTGMPPFSALMSSADASRVAAYIGSLGHGASSATARGNVSIGETVFNRSGCQQCHTIAGVGGNLGPELTDIGSLRQADKLRQELLSPGTDLPLKRSARGLSAPVVAYPMFNAVTKNGRTVEGMRVAEDTFNIVLEDVNGNFHSLSKLDLRSLDKEPGKSFMPSVKGVLSDAELNDLIAYLSSLKGKP